MTSPGSDANSSEKIRLYLGTGCGKTTATFGVILRALSCRQSVTIVFFDKLEENSSEGPALRHLSTLGEAGFGRLSVHYTGVNRIGSGPNGSFRLYSCENGILPEDTEAARKGIRYLIEALERKDNIVICDELLDIGRVGIIDWREIRPIIEARQAPTILILTGRRAPDWLMAAATTISSTVQLRHHGRAIAGIDC